MAPTTAPPAVRTKALHEGHHDEDRGEDEHHAGRLGQAAAHVRESASPGAVDVPPDTATDGVVQPRPERGTVTAIAT